jgi:cytochrome c
MVTMKELVSLSRRFVLAALVFISPLALAAEHASADDAVALVKSAISYIKANGRDKAMAVLNDDPQGQFHHGELYVTVYDMNGISLANGVNKRLVGKSMMDLKDPDGVYITRERIKMIKEKGSGWLEFKWPNPATKQIETKLMYSERVDDLIVSSGIYK